MAVTGSVRKVEGLCVWVQLASSYIHAHTHMHAKYSLLSNALSPVTSLVFFLMLSGVKWNWTQGLIYTSGSVRLFLGQTEYVGPIASS